MSISFRNLVRVRMKPGDDLLMFIIRGTCPNYWAEPISSPGGYPIDFELAGILHSTQPNPPALSSYFPRFHEGHLGRWDWIRPMPS